jgi:ABC-type uncharacterized transport system ATPase subunit
VLTPPEKDRLFAVLRGLRAEGRSVVIVTHKLHEVMELADRVTVMRDGRVVASVATGDTSGPELARLMVGRDVSLRADKQPKQRGECVLSVDDLHVRGEDGREKVRGVTLDVYAGEIVGIAGVDGNGQSEFAEAIMGLRPVERGRISLKGDAITRLSVARRRARGLDYVPADRRHVGSIAELSIADNAILGSQRARTSGPFLDRDQDTRLCPHSRRPFRSARRRNRRSRSQALRRQPAEGHPWPRNHARTHCPDRRTAHARSRHRRGRGRLAGDPPRTRARGRRSC